MNTIDTKLNDFSHQMSLVKQEIAIKNSLNKERFQKEGENATLVQEQIFEQIRTLSEKIAHIGFTKNNDESPILNEFSSPTIKPSKKEFAVLRSEIAEFKSDFETIMNERLTKMQEYLEDEIKLGMSNNSFQSKLRKSKI